MMIRKLCRKSILVAHQTTNGGYVLMMVLVLLIVLTTALTSIATRSMQTTHEAVVAVTRLQQRIGIDSCRKTLLLKADLVFKTIDASRRDGRGQPSPEASHMVADMIALGGQRFDLVLSDENAKVNLNTIHYYSGQSKVTEVLQKTLSVSDARALVLRPGAGSSTSGAARAQESSAKSSKRQDKSDASGSNPAGSGAESSTEATVLPAYRSWGEVFDFGMLVNQSRDKQVQLEFTKTFTLWGGGQINIYRASDSSISMLMAEVVTPAEAKKILTKIRESSTVDLQLIIDQEVERPTARQRLRAILGKNSFAYSLFIDVAAPQSRSRKLFVNAVDIKGVQEISEFVFH